MEMAESNYLMRGTDETNVILLEIRINPALSATILERTWLCCTNALGIYGNSHLKVWPKGCLTRVVSTQNIEEPTWEV